jgi:uroporphyrinogen decarboxylase
MNDTFLRACRGEKTEYTPVWLMRQAGRYLKEYQEVRAKVDFLTLCKTPELAAKVTLQPIDILGVDAAILFSDILIPVEAMGMHLEFSEKKGPILNEPVRSKSAVDRLIIPDTEDSMPFVLETIRILRGELKVPLIGFSGAWTRSPPRWSNTFRRRSGPEHRRCSFSTPGPAASLPMTMKTSSFRM